jgi:hypothetical protein
MLDVAERDDMCVLSWLWLRQVLLSIFVATDLRYVCANRTVFLDS